MEHRAKRSPEHNSWRQAKVRCYTATSPKYPAYGGRGIRMHERWQKDFAVFFADMGPRPLGTTLDRIDVDGDYAPGNCRWATKEEQRRNRRVPTKLTVSSVAAIRQAEGQLSGRQLASQFGVSQHTVWMVQKRRIYKDFP